MGMKVNKIETNLKRNLWLHSSYVTFLATKTSPENEVIRINPTISFQKLLGFGGALTESSCYLLNTIDKNLANEILEEYWGKENLNYQFARISVGSCDFSLGSYSYASEKNLEDFSIEHDKKHILPILKLAKEKNPTLQFLASPWSPPSFMKDNNSLTGGGRLLPSYKKLWAIYLTKFVYNYQNQGIPISYMTIQNEPNAKQIWESCLYSAQEEADFLKNYLFPSFKEKNLNTKFLIWDHNKDNLLERCTETLVEHQALNYTSGIAFHWYTGRSF